jgi:hypothetical protein
MDKLDYDANTAGPFELRPVTRWLPDFSDAAFLERYRAQREVIAGAGPTHEAAWWEEQQTEAGWR